jgi:hypothetical protein
MKMKARRRKLALRVQAWNQLKSVLKDNGPAGRLAAGGYKCPGSLK